jgi:TorA maturation chaperone TorD
MGLALNAASGSALAEDFASLALLHDREFTPALILALRQADFPGNLAMLPRDDAGRDGVEAMHRALAALPSDLDADCVDGLAADFAAIYLTAAYGASPSESYWLSDDHLVCQSPMFELREEYKARGLAVPDWRLRPDDHLVFQLQFVAHLLNSVANADDWRALGRFMDFHLLRWLPDFARRVAARCETPLYAALAMLTFAWCDQLRALIAGNLGEAALTADEVAAQLNSQRVGDALAEPVRFFPGASGPSW